MEFSIKAQPLTKDKIDRILLSLKKGGNVTFAFGYDDLNCLSLLNEEIFQKRNDILLHVWSVRDNNLLTDKELDELAKMNHVRKLKMTGIMNKSFAELQNMNNIEELSLVSRSPIDISFTNKLSRLKSLSLEGRVKSLECLEYNTNLEYLYLQTTINSFQFVHKMNKLKKIIIDSCISTFDFSPLKYVNLEYLGIHSIKRLDNVDSIVDITTLGELHLDASNLKTLPSFSNLNNLKTVSLKNMRIWENPSILKTITNLESLELEEINTKLKAEDFFFLEEIESLKILDFRFIDFNKKRIEKLYTHFKGSNIIIK